ncbi:MAG: HAMP domain-containing histidine kinase, partial [Eggerthellaceae bacterium]|nr:HAMP domain-containing histidine kinase [Eggerthellaceae bacterium]
MTPQAIAKLRRTFIIIAMASFFVVIAFMGVTTIASNVRAVANQANRTIDAIVDAGGETPRQDNFGDGPFHEEASYGLRFFSVAFDDEGEVTNVDLSHVRSIGSDAAVELADVAADPSSITGLGRYDNYLFKESETDDGSMVVFLDCSIQLANLRDVVINTILLCIAALVVTFVPVFFFSKRAIRSEIENAERQQQFVTNAGHELKTPIAVIRANTELTEMMSGETEWTQSTLRQVDRLDGLVRDLMTIARGVERVSSGEALAEVDVSRVVSDAVDSFKGPAVNNDLKLTSDIGQGIALRSNDKIVEQLVCLLVDNAIKYCDAEGHIDVRLTPSHIGRGCTLVVSNDYAAGGDVDYRRFFDRFYREDESHENQTGYGIGLSVAESICKSYHGSIKASWKAGVISFA